MAKKAKSDSVSVNRSPIQILSHKRSKEEFWISNYQREEFWPAETYHGWTTDQFVKKLQLVFSKQSTDYPIEVEHYKETRTGYYLIFYGSSNHILDHRGIAFLTPEIVDRCNRGEIKLLVAFVHETFDGNTSAREWFWSFADVLTRVGITRSNSVVILTSTVLHNRPHNDWRCDFVYYPWFELDLQHSVKFNATPYMQLPEINFNKKIKHFINLNLNLRPHRFLILMYLMYRGVADQGYISWKNPVNLSWREIVHSYGFPNHDFGWQGQLSRFNHRDPGFFQFVSQINILNSINLDNLNLQDGTYCPIPNQTWIGAHEFYQESAVELINETHHELYGDVFLTEKTFKPILHGLPFLYNASQNHLKEVKRTGYQSFPELFNEEYDHMSSSMSKIVTVAEELIAFCSQPEKLNLLKNSPDILEKLKFNQTLFWNKNHASELGRLLHDAWNLGRA